jgi:hypothetical protein
MYGLALAFVDCIKGRRAEKLRFEKMGKRPQWPDPSQASPYRR